MQDMFLKQCLLLFDSWWLFVLEPISLVLQDVGPEWLFLSLELQFKHTSLLLKLLSIILLQLSFLLLLCPILFHVFFEDFHFNLLLIHLVFNFIHLSLHWRCRGRLLKYWLELLLAIVTFDLFMLSLHFMSLCLNFLSFCFHLHL